MAWVFGLSAECGPSQDRARELQRHFDRWPSRVSRYDEPDWWCVVVPDGLSLVGVTSEADATAMTAAGHELYACLRAAPPVYRYALVGVETEEFRTFPELLAEENPSVLTGLVVGEDIWATVGRPVGFEEFVPGYRWIPYAGEPW